MIGIRCIGFQHPCINGKTLTTDETGFRAGALVQNRGLRAVINTDVVQFALALIGSFNYAWAAAGP
jgi:hypothetical protein